MTVPEKTVTDIAARGIEITVVKKAKGGVQYNPLPGRTESLCRGCSDRAMQAFR